MEDNVYAFHVEKKPKQVRLVDPEQCRLPATDLDGRLGCFSLSSEVTAEPEPFERRLGDAGVAGGSSAEERELGLALAAQDGEVDLDAGDSA